MTRHDWPGGHPLPPDLTDLLLAGTVGREHCTRAAALAQAAMAGAGAPEDRAALCRLRLGLLAAALEEDSLHGPTAAALVAAMDRQGAFGPVDPALAGLARDLARDFSMPDSVAYYQRLAASGEADRLRRYLDNECRAGRHRLFWLHVALRRAVLVREFAWGEALVRESLPPRLAPLGEKLRGDLALLAGRPDLALARYQTAQAQAPWPTGLFRLGLAAWQAGDTGRALARLGDTVRRHPWHVSAALALFDLATGRDTAVAAVPGRLAVCLYTYSKAADLDRTLAGLFASDLGQAAVTVLDNASADQTPAVVTGWQGRVGPERLRSLRLPVNIGAPAARNWLAADPGVREADFVAYLDDDVRLPGDWLGRLGAAVTAYPEAGVWGCRIVDAGNPAVAQGVGATLLPPEAGAPGPHDPKLSDAQAETFDTGVFGHLRPCLSVMGCCHLFRRERLLAAGGFDIRFSPSQYDDVDHDLRLALAGRPAVYQGHLAVGHARPAPVFAPPRPDQLACGQANKGKLLAKHRERFGEMAAGLRLALVADLTEKRRALAEAGLLSQGE